MSLKAEGLPDAADGLMRHPRLLVHRARASVRRRFWLDLQRLAHDLRDLFVLNASRRSGPWQVSQPGQTLHPESLPPRAYPLIMRSFDAGSVIITDSF